MQISIAEEGGNMKPLSLVILFLVFSIFPNWMLFSQNKSFKENDIIPEGKAVIYIYNYGFQGESMLFSEEGPIGILPNGKYIRHIANPGEARFYNISKLGFAEIKIGVNAGQLYYLKATGNLLVVTDKKALVEIIYCKLKE